MGKAAVLYTFPVVLVGWVFFKAEYLHVSLGYFRRMLTWHADTTDWRPDKEYITLLIIAVFFSFFAIPDLGKRIQEKIFYKDYSLKMYFAMAFVGLLLCIISAGRITVSTFNPFIYFRF
jgi:hypothetical protein